MYWFVPCSNVMVGIVTLKWVICISPVLAMKTKLLYIQVLLSPEACFALVLGGIIFRDNIIVLIISDRIVIPSHWKFTDAIDRCLWYQTTLI